MRRGAEVTFAGVGNAGRTAKHVRHCVTKNICELGAITLLSMKALKKKSKRKRDPSMPFGELVQTVATGVERARTESSKGEESTVSRKTTANSEEVARGVLTRFVGIERKCGIAD